MSEGKQITVLSLLQDIDAAMGTMSQHNPNRRLLLRCSYGLIEMTHRARGMELPERGMNLPELGPVDVEGVPV